MKEKSKLTVALCLITWNEINGCKHDVPLIDSNQFEQIFCLDGGSEDGTAEYLEAQGITVYQQNENGLNSACKEAVHYCLCDAIIFYHPKGTIPVTDIYKFREFFDSGYDLVIASRMMAHSVNEEDSHFLKPRKWFVLALSTLASLLFRKEGNVIRDVLHGFRGMKVVSFQKLEISNFSPSIDIEMVCRSYKFRLKRIEFPTKEASRIAGETHFKAFPTGKKLLKYIWREIKRKD